MGSPPWSWTQRVVRSAFDIPPWLPPPCATQNDVPFYLDLVHPWRMQRLPPPCAYKNGVDTTIVHPFCILLWALIHLLVLCILHHIFTFADLFISTDRSTVIKHFKSELDENNMHTQKYRLLFTRLHAFGARRFRGTRRYPQYRWTALTCSFDTWPEIGVFQVTVVC